MSKQSIFGRIAQLAKANINALIDSAEDPGLMLDQMVRDYTNSIAEAESAIAQTIGNLRLLEQDHAEDIANADDWGRKALAASRKADELRSGGNAADADKFDSLAKVALGRQLSAEKEARTAEPTIATQTKVVEQLKNGLNAMRGKLSELSAKRDELNARAKTARRSRRCRMPSRASTCSTRPASWAASSRRSAAKRRASEDHRSSPHPASTPSLSSWRPRTNRWSWTRGWRR